MTTTSDTTPRQLVRYVSWVSDVMPLRTIVYTARQWDNGDIDLSAVDHASGAQQFYDDYEWADCILDVLDNEDRKARAATSRY